LLVFAVVTGVALDRHSLGGPMGAAPNAEPEISDA
jgi:hypothetical protein